MTDLRNHPKTGLRERKKRQTHDTIRAVAVELFDRQGFARTTIAEIADAANVSPRTVSSYFPAKEDLVLAGYVEVFERLDERFRRLRAGETMADALRSWLVEDAPHGMLDQTAVRVRRIIRGDPHLRAYEKHLNARAEELFARAIATDTGTDPDSLEARMAAAATVAVFGVMSIHRESTSGTAGPEEAKAQAVELLDRALLFVEAGVRALRR